MFEDSQGKQEYERTNKTKQRFRFLLATAYRKKYYGLWKKVIRLYANVQTPDGKQSHEEREHSYGCMTICHRV